MANEHKSAPKAKDLDLDEAWDNAVIEPEPATVRKPNPFRADTKRIPLATLRALLKKSRDDDGEG